MKRVLVIGPHDKHMKNLLKCSNIEKYYIQKTIKIKNLKYYRKNKLLNFFNSYFFYVCKY